MNTAVARAEIAVPQNRQILNSWKEIAAYLGKGVRTVQRYEAHFGLPIRRISATNHAAVMAFADELNSWLLSPSKLTRKHCKEYNALLKAIEQHAAECPECNQLEKVVAIDSPSGSK